MPRSGTTLTRAMLDAHPDISCGKETRVIPRILALKQMWSWSSKEKICLDEADVTEEVLDSPMQAFLLEDTAVTAPRLAKLGYDSYANPPNYGKPDPKILENTRRVFKGEFQLPDFLKEKPQIEQVE
ncbi:protein-tyrosine sulfotransferase 1 isoform X2 [Sigmodon hispidus]